MHAISQHDIDISVQRCELDSHADTCCFTSDAYLLSQTYHSVEVTGFLDTLGTVTEVRVATVAVAYDCPVSMETFILIFHESLFIPGLQNHLLCPFQMRNNSVIVNKCPLQYIDPTQRNSYSHAVITDRLHIPLLLHGIISHFLVRKPTEDEVCNPHLYTQIEMTSANAWEPRNLHFGEIEKALRVNTPSIFPESDVRMRYISTVTTTLCDISSALDQDAFFDCLQLYADTSPDFQVSVAVSKRKGTVTPTDLARRWYIGVEAARRTIERTTQRAVRDFAFTSGIRRLKATAYQLKYRHLRASVYTDTMYSKVKSLRQNTCAQIYVTSFYWCAVYPIQRQADAHYTLDSVVLRDVGVFNVIIPDNALELTKGEFRRKTLRAGAEMRPIEAYMHNQNLAELCIRELRRMYRKAMLTANAPQVPVPTPTAAKPSPMPNPIPIGCVTDETGLRSSVLNIPNNSMTLTTIELCAKYIAINVNQPSGMARYSGINLIDKFVRFQCTLGNPREKCVIDAQQRSRHFYLMNSTASFNGITFKNGNALNEFFSSGGSFFIEFLSMVKINDCDFIGCAASAGGAMFTRFSTIQMANVSFKNNIGGAIQSGYSSLVTIINGLLTNNSNNVSYIILSS